VRPRPSRWTPRPEAGSGVGSSLQRYRRPTGVRTAGQIAPSKQPCNASEPRTDGYSIVHRPTRGRTEAHPFPVSKSSGSPSPAVAIKSKVQSLSKRQQEHRVARGLPRILHKATFGEPPCLVSHRHSVQLDSSPSQVIPERTVPSRRGRQPPPSPSEADPAEPRIAGGGSASAAVTTAA